MRRVLVLCALLLSGCTFQATPDVPETQDVPPAPTLPVRQVSTEFLIYNEQTGKCIDLPYYEAGRIDGPVSQFTCRGSGDNQRWEFLEAPVNELRLYAIRNVKDGLCLDVPFDGSALVGEVITEFPCRGLEDNQHFRKIERPAGGYWLVHDKSGLCLDVAGPANKSNDARLALWPCSDYDDHLWRERSPDDFPG